MAQIGSPLRRAGSMRRDFEFGCVYDVIPGILSFSILDSEQVMPPVQTGG